MNIIDVACLVFPDGTVRWVDPDLLVRAVKEWRDANPEYRTTSCTMGAVQIRMPEENIPT